MRSVITAKIKIPTEPAILETLNVYKRGLQFCIDEAWSRNIRNNVKLQPFVYKDLKAMGLQAQLAISCIKQSCGMVKKAKTKPEVANASIRYNFPRSASFKNNVLSISTLQGRIKVPFTIPECYMEYFSWKVIESLLRIDKEGRCFFLFSFSKEVEVSNNASQQVLGVDLGINNLAVTSDGVIFKTPKTRIHQFHYLRRMLQSKGTKSAKRSLRALSGRQKRFMRSYNHVVSKKIVESADVIVMENLKGIRRQRKGKRFNRWLNSWSFFQLQNFISYKAIKQGKRAITVNPYLTSQTCSSCGSLGSRYFDYFSCHCGFSSQSDFNASCNLRGLHVTQPNIWTNDAKGVPSNAIAVDVMDKSPRL